MQYIGFFFRFFIWFSLRNLRRHLGRALTVLLGIALGAAVFTSVRLSIHAALESFTRSMEVISGQADRVLVQPGGRVPEAWGAKLIRLPIVHEASPILTTYVRFSEEKAEPFLLIGFDPILDRSFRKWQTSRHTGEDTGSWLELLKRPFTVIVGKSLAEKYACRIGDLRAIEHTRQTSDFTVVGILSPNGLALAEGGMIALTDIATFQEFTQIYGSVDRIDIKLEPKATNKDFEQIQKILPENILLGSPSAAKESGQIMIRAYQLNLSILSFASLFVGMFLVYSLVALNAASRRHELAVLRATGASPMLLFMVFLAEGALFGMVGWITALPISTLWVKYLLQGVSQTISTLFVRVQVNTLSLSPWEVILSFSVTVLISGIAALQPAREAMRVPPKEVLMVAPAAGSRRRSARRLAFAGLPLILFAVPLSWLPGLYGLPLAGYAAMFFLFVGFAFLAPYSLEKMGETSSYQQSLRRWQTP